MIILAIESSCDETGVAIIKAEGKKFEVLANMLKTQIDIHAITNGVVPEVAAREHVLVINPLIEQALKESGVEMKEVDLIAVTNGPGLIGSLLIGIEAAKVLSYIYNIPLVGINHLKAHIQANFFNRESGVIEDLHYPGLALLVSGGHTELVRMDSMIDFEIIGQTLDDAVGESFDKVARQLDLPYPGGPAISKLAESGNDKSYDLPIPLKHTKDFNFSYSGLKTAVRDIVTHRVGDLSEEEKKNLAASFQRVAVEHLINKTLKAIEKTGAKTLVVAGGVSANKHLRSELEQRLPDGVELRVPPFELCTDNALMIAMAAYIEDQNGGVKTGAEEWRTITADPGMDI